MRWPEPGAVREAATVWAQRVRAEHSGVQAVGLFGSLARATGWGVGSDVDLVVVVASSDAPFVERGVAFPADALPVPADVLVYTAAEWAGASGPVAIRRGVQWLAGTPPAAR